MISVTACTGLIPGVCLEARNATWISTVFLELENVDALRNDLFAAARAQRENAAFKRFGAYSDRIGSSVYIVVKKGVPILRVCQDDIEVAITLDDPETLRTALMIAGCNAIKQRIETGIGRVGKEV